MIRLDTDECVRGPIIHALRRRGVDVLMAVEDGREGAGDPAVLDRAGALGRLLYSEDKDLVIEAEHRQRDGIPFIGVVYGHAKRVSIGRCVSDLELIACCSDIEEYSGKLVRLPLGR